MSRSQGVILPQCSDSATFVLNMFTLCMSRGHPPLQDAQHKNNILNKQVKGGYLLRYRRGFFCKGWCEEWVVLYEDSTLAWYSDKGLSRPRGFVRISEAPELLAVGEWTRQVPRRPRFPRSCHIGQLLAVGSRALHEVHWLMAQSPAEISDWMTAISNTLPPPPHLPLDDKQETLGNNRSQQNQQLANGCVTNIRNGNCIREQSSQPCNNDSNIGGGGKSQNQNYNNDHTVLSGVVIDWGHGWGWGQATLAAQTACVAAHEGAVSSAIYYHAAEDYALGGCDEVDWSAFGDFSF